MRDAWSLRIHNSHTKLVQEVASMKFGSTPITDWLPAKHPLHTSHLDPSQGWGGIVSFEDLRSALVCHRTVYCTFNAVRQAPEDYNEILDELELIRNTYAVSIESRMVIDELLLGFIQELWVVAATQENLISSGVIPPSSCHPLKDARDITYKNGHSFNENLKNLKLASPSSFEEKRRAMADRLRSCSAPTPTLPSTVHAPSPHPPHTDPPQRPLSPSTRIQVHPFEDSAPPNMSPPSPVITVITDDVVDWFDSYQRRWGARRMCIQDILLQHGCPLGAAYPDATFHFGKGRSREMRRPSKRVLPRPRRTSPRYHGQRTPPLAATVTRSPHHRPVAPHIKRHPRTGFSSTRQKRPRWILTHSRSTDLPA